MLGPVLAEYGLQAGEQQAAVILAHLRSLSGRLALKLVSSPTARGEALGLALARMFLEYQGALRNQIVVPLDAHLELFSVASNQAESIGDEVTVRRTDLALFDLDLAQRTIACNLIEVKCCARTLGVGGYGQLKEQMIDQIDQSERVLRTHFDPRRTTPDRPDRLLKTRELVTLLDFHLDRGARYGLLERDAEAEARAFLDVLEEGYSLRFSRSGLVFDFDKSGTEPPEHEAGIEFHRVGVDLIRRLVEHAASRVAGGDQGADRSGGGAPPVIDPAADRPLPPLDTAAFLVADRARSTSDLDREGAPVPGGGIARPERGAASTTDETSATPVRDEQPAGGKKRTPSGDSPASGTRETRRVGEAASGTETLRGDRRPAPEPKPPAVPPPASKSPTAPPPKRPAPKPPAASPPETPVQPVLPVAPAEPSAAEGGPACDAVLGATAASPQYGLLGRTSGRSVALDLNQTHTISLFGVQGGGKSYTLGSVVEMACMSIDGVNRLPHPLAGVIFHYSATLDYRPEFTSMAAPNAGGAEADLLRADYGAAPRALDDLVILTPAAKVEERRAEYPGIEILPIAFAASELKASHWKFLMGAVGSQSLYIRQLALIMKKLRGGVTLDALRQGVQDSGLSDYLKDLALLRLRFAEEYVDDARRLTDVLRPGRLVIVDLRDELIEKDEALGLFVVLLQLFAETTWQGRRFNKLVVFDEAHKYIDSPDLVAGLVEVVREMRHKGTSVMVASQDPPSVPTSLIELSTQIILHKCNSPAWLKHVQKANAALDALTPAKLAALGPGEAYVWSSRATDDAFTRGAVKVGCRPRVTKHGGGTRTAVSGPKQR